MRGLLSLCTDESSLFCCKMSHSNFFLDVPMRKLFLLLLNSVHCVVQLSLYLVLSNYV